MLVREELKDKKKNQYFTLLNMKDTNAVFQLSAIIKCGLLINKKKWTKIKIMLINITEHKLG